MNASYLAIVLWIGSMIAQFIAYMWLASKNENKQRGRDEIKMAEMLAHREEISQLKEEAIEHRLMTENIATYLEAKNGITFRRY